MKPLRYKLNIIRLILSSWIFLSLSTSTCEAVKNYNVTLEIEPLSVKRGQSVLLRCSYNLERDPLYSVKWYRGQYEFYRFTPSENPPAKIFTFANIKVDLTASNDTQVTLRNVDFRLSGNFTCEVTADAPSFHTSFASNTLTVVELPDVKPTIWTERDKYDPGDILRANCTSPPSKPGVNMLFFLNSIPKKTNGFHCPTAQWKSNCPQSERLWARLSSTQT
ncbi:hypothetical protein ACFFRR_006173 [Megaselia abdita]